MIHIQPIVGSFQIGLLCLFNAVIGTFELSRSDCSVQSDASDSQNILRLVTRPYYYRCRVKHLSDSSKPVFAVTKE